jgi:hypothetical protein
MLISCGVAATKKSLKHHQAPVVLSANATRGHAMMLHFLLAISILKPNNCFSGSLLSF